MGKGDHRKGSTNFLKMNCMEVLGLGMKSRGDEGLETLVERMQAVKTYKDCGFGSLENHGKC